MIRKKLILLLSSSFSLLFLFPQLIQAQGNPPDYTYEIKPDLVSGVDAVVKTNNNDNGVTAATNFFSGTLGAYSLNNSEVHGKMRSFFKFDDIKKIPAGSTIVSAKLSLYGVDQSEHYSQNNSGENSFVLRKVVSDWSDTTINWNNQPLTSSVNEVVILSGVQLRTPDFTNIDVTQLITDLYNDSSNNFGISLLLLNENQESSICFSSSENENNALIPTLTLVLRSPCAFITKQIFLSYSPKFGKIAKDAVVSTRGGGSGGVLPYDASNSNFGNVQDEALATWTYGGYPGISRSYIEFNFLTNFIKNFRGNDMKILSARLFLYGIPNPSHSPQGNCRSCPENSNADTDNSCWLNRVSTPWLENTITWNNAPVLANSYVEIPPSQSKYNWDVTSLDISDLISSMISNPNNSNGFAISLKDESLNGADHSKKRSLSFASFDYPDITKHPRIELVVMYNATNSYFERELIIQPPGSFGEDAQIIRYKNGGGNGNSGGSPDLSAGVWRYGSGNSYQHIEERSLIKFDLSQFDQSKFIVKADLQLSPTGYHTNNGSTGSWLNRTTNTWSEYGVTWNNQPPFTEINRKWIPQHNSSNNYYATVNVTGLIQDMVRIGNHGFLWRLNNEEWSSGASGPTPNRFITFASSDHGDAWRRPKLVVKYIDQCPPYTTYKASQFLYNPAGRDLPSESIIAEKKANTDFIIIPNPILNNVIGLTYNAIKQGVIDISVMNAMGNKVLISQRRLVLKGMNRIEINSVNLSKGVYYVNIIEDGKTKVQKFIK